MKGRSRVKGERNDFRHNTKTNNAKTAQNRLPNLEVFPADFAMVSEFVVAVEVLRMTLEIV